MEQTNSAESIVPGFIFAVGEGASYVFNGDSYPVTVMKVSASGKTVWVSEDMAFKAQHGDADASLHPSTWTMFTFRAKTKTFKMAGGNTWTLTRGRRFTQNPSF